LRLCGCVSAERRTLQQLVAVLASSDGPTDDEVMGLKYTLVTVWHDAGCIDQSDAMDEWLEKAEQKAEVLATV
jgi:hypothetical protein